MLQYPGKAYQESWKVECLCLPVVRCPRLWELSLLMWLGCFKLCSQAGKDSVCRLQVFGGLWRELICLHLTQRVLASTKDLTESGQTFVG